MVNVKRHPVGSRPALTPPSPTTAAAAQLQHPNRWEGLDALTECQQGGRNSYHKYVAAHGYGKKF